jgi:hypothetical protein
MASTSAPNTKTRRNSSTEKGDLREQLLADLRGGAKGIRRWNERPLKERKAGLKGRGPDLAGAALTGADLAGLPLAGACFDRAVLVKAWLLEADLKRATFRETNLAEGWCAGANLQGADFTGASLVRANLRGCDCRGAAFKGCDLDEANLGGANLCGADLSLANLRGAVFADTLYDEGTHWPSGFRPPVGLVWAGRGAVPRGLDVFVRRLEFLVDNRRLGRALDMLKAEPFQLYASVEDDEVRGAITSQSEPDTVYSCRLGADGRFACCNHELTACVGMREALCKHLLLLIIGLARTGAVDPEAVERWVQASRQRKPKVEREVMSETLERYQAAQAGKQVWRPTRTVPEDYFSL